MSLFSYADEPLGVFPDDERKSRAGEYQTDGCLTVSVCLVGVSVEHGHTKTN